MISFWLIGHASVDTVYEESILEPHNKMGYIDLVNLVWYLSSKSLVKPFFCGCLLWEVRSKKLPLRESDCFHDDDDDALSSQKSADRVTNDVPFIPFLRGLRSFGRREGRPPFEYYLQLSAHVGPCDRVDNYLFGFGQQNNILQTATLQKICWC